MVQPQIGSLKDHKESIGNNPSAGDNPNVEVNATNSVIVIPDAVTKVSVVEDGGKHSAGKKLQLSRQYKAKKNLLMPICFLLMFISGAGVIGLTAVEALRHIDSQSRLSGIMPRFFTMRFESSSSGEFHVHKDMGGNVHRTTLASSDHCLHRRDVLMSNGPLEILHDTKSKWSVIISQNQSQCFLHSTSNFVSSCPTSYPWQLDEIMGVFTARAAMETSMRRTLTRVVSRLYTSYPISDISCAGKPIFEACKGKLAYEVRAVAMCYIDSKMSRAERAATFLLKDPSSPSIERTLYDVEHNPKLKTKDLVSILRTTISNDDAILSEESTGPMKKPKSETSGQMLLALLDEDDAKKELI